MHLTLGLRACGRGASLLVNYLDVAAGAGSWAATSGSPSAPPLATAGGGAPSGGGAVSRGPDNDDDDRRLDDLRLPLSRPLFFLAAFSPPPPLLSTSPPLLSSRSSLPAVVPGRPGAGPLLEAVEPDDRLGCGDGRSPGGPDAAASPPPGARGGAPRLSWSSLSRSRHCCWRAWAAIGSRSTPTPRS